MARVVPHFSKGSSLAGQYDQTTQCGYGPSRYPAGQKEDNLAINLKI